MFACCCNWLCMDSTDVDPSGRADRRHQSYTNSAFNSQPSPPPPEHTCKACGGSFDTPARKHVCVDCKKNYCSGCSAQQGLRPRLCHTCQRFYGNLLERAELMKLKVKELRDYLHLHEVSTHLCREKEELVELVLSQQSSPSGSSAPDTPIVQPPTVTSDPPDPTPHISVSDSSSDASSPGPPTPEPEAPPPDSETPPSDAELEEDDPAWDPEEAPVSGRRASLSDLKSVDDIEDLSVRQLKEILARNFVDYKGCCEKWELMERVTRLYHDQQNLLAANSVNAAGECGGGPAPGQEENLCKICMDSPIDCVLLECGHMVTCTKCGKRMSECPICRQYVIRAVHVFRS
ncbi:E3 ubiquitin-protein ligase rififylin isoform X1 [Poecilia latipinna]|uniref:E3 ubiquitin-protein ligase rififylin isoform X1 n=1 Tax=Poecilia latipinna TaxID=48699 RepID=UPI00072E7C0A|nr:PREDICTED: E3 ubiquitin-protein ligase rififylin isoform X1 [Poecilia latipinna]